MLVVVLVLDPDLTNFVVVDAVVFVVDVVEEVIVVVDFLEVLIDVVAIPS